MKTVVGRRIRCWPATNGRSRASSSASFSRLYTVDTQDERLSAQFFPDK